MGRTSIDAVSYPRRKNGVSTIWSSEDFERTKTPSCPRKQKSSGCCSFTPPPSSAPCFSALCLALAALPPPFFLLVLSLSFSLSVSRGAPPVVLASASAVSILLRCTSPDPTDFFDCTNFSWIGWRLFILFLSCPFSR